MCFKNDLTATQAADLSGVNRNTANRYYNLLRRAILSESIREAKREVGEYELDESYFGARRVRGKRGRRQDSGVRAAQARGQGVRDNRTRLLAGVPDANHPRANS